MQSTIDQPTQSVAAPHIKIVNVAEFCRKFRLNPKRNDD